MTPSITYYLSGVRDYITSNVFEDIWPLSWQEVLQLMAMTLLAENLSGLIILMNMEPRVIPQQNMRAKANCFYSKLCESERKWSKGLCNLNTSWIHKCMCHLGSWHDNSKVPFIIQITRILNQLHHTKFSG